MKRFALALAALVPLAPVAPAPLAAQDCSAQGDLTGQAAARCAEMEWLSADHELNDAWHLAMAAARRLDQLVPPHERPVSEQLRAAQRAWIAFRDRACAAESMLRAGADRPEMKFGCLRRLTRDRITDLYFFAEAN